MTEVLKKDMNISLEGPRNKQWKKINKAVQDLKVEWNKEKEPGRNLEMKH